MQIEYGDFYKFIVSVGIALIILSVLLPWAFVREPFDLLNTQVDIAALTKVAQFVIQARQILTAIITFVVPCLSVSLFAFGVVLTVFGSVQWHTKNQSINDELQRIKLQLEREKLTPVSDEEKKEALEVEGRAELEIQQELPERDQGAVLEQIDLSELNNFVASALLVEAKLAKRLRNCIGGLYDVLSNQRLGRVEYDVLLLSKDTESKLKDYVIEIKYVRKGFKYGWLLDNVEKIFYANLHYQREMNRRPMPMLIVIAPKQVLITPQRARYLERIREELAIKKMKVQVRYLPEDDLTHLSCDELVAKLGL